MANTIPEYQRKQLESSLTGTPGQDTSGQTAGAAVANLGISAANVLAPIVEKRREAANLSFANRSLIDTDLIFEQTQQAHDKEYADFRGDPIERNRALKDKLTNNLNASLNGIDNVDVRNAVDRVGQQYISQRMAKEFKTSSDRQGIHAFEDVVGASNTLASSAREAGHSGDLSRFDDLLQQAKGVSVAGVSVLSPQQQAELSTSVPKSIASGFIFGMTETNPAAAVKVLESGKFAGIFTPTELEHFVAEAGNTEVQQTTRASAKLAQASDDRRFQYTSKIIRGLPVSRSEVINDVGTLLTPKDGEEILKMAAEPPPVTSDDTVRMDMNAKLYSGTLKSDDILYNASRLSAAERKDFTEKLTSEIAANPAVKRAYQTLDAQFQKDAFGVRQLVDQQVLNDSTDELYRRAQAGKERPDLIAEDLIKRIKIAKQKNVGTFFGRQMLTAMGEDITAKKIEEQRANVLQRYTNHEISLKASDNFLQQLDELEGTL